MCLFRSHKQTLAVSEEAWTQGPPICLQPISQHSPERKSLSPHPGYTSSRGIPTAPSPCPKVTSWHQGLRFASFSCEVSAPKQTWGYAWQVCFLNVGAPSFLINNHRCAFPFINRYVKDSWDVILLSIQVYSNVALAPSNCPCWKCVAVPVSLLKMLCQIQRQTIWAKHMNYVCWSMELTENTRHFWVSHHLCYNKFTPTRNPRWFKDTCVCLHTHTHTHSLTHSLTLIPSKEGHTQGRQDSHLALRDIKTSSWSSVISEERLSIKTGKW